MSRQYPNLFGKLVLHSGAYGQDMRGRWFARPPAGNSMAIAERDVLEHADGTITVSGFIHSGQWRAGA